MHGAAIASSGAHAPPGPVQFFANPTDPKVAERVNRMVKFVCLTICTDGDESHADEWFDIPDSAEHLVKYMMATVDVKARKNSNPNRTHADGTARVQVIDSRHYPPIRQISDEFRAPSTCPVI